VITAIATGAIATGLAACGSESGRDPGVKRLSFKLTDAGCEPAEASAPAGPIDFEVTNDGSASVMELEVLDGGQILGEKENLAERLSGSFSLTLDKGTYTLYCPNGSENERGTLTVPGDPAPDASTPELEHAVDTYRAYVERDTAELVARTTPFAAAVESGDVARAKELYAQARVPYERIEPVAESFGDLDPEIDARAGDVPAKQFGGFHRIEQALWIDGSTPGMAPVAQELVKNVETLNRKVKTIKLQPAQLANGANELLGEVSSSKITGEEERYSHTDLVDFKANVNGSAAAYDALAPALRKEDPELAREIEQRFRATYAALRPYRRGSGYVSYTQLTPPTPASSPGRSTRSPNRSRRSPLRSTGERGPAALLHAAPSSGRRRGDGTRARHRRLSAGARDGRERRARRHRPVPRRAPGGDRNRRPGPPPLRLLRPHHGAARGCPRAAPGVDGRGGADDPGQDGRR
jgi:iron uptake system component EfeO